jgi:hypothetical protein
MVQFRERLAEGACLFAAVRAELKSQADRMKKEIDSGFDDVILVYKARLEEARLKKAGQDSARQKIEDDIRTCVENVIEPTLKDICNRKLKPGGWECESRLSRDRLSVTFDIYQGDMKVARGEGRPNIRFVGNRGNSTIGVSSTTASHLNSEEAHDSRRLNEDLVSEQVLEFFRSLVSA